ncbi:MAG: hypothetical protein QXU32_07565 [Nitrososphaerales archaeon]
MTNSEDISTALAVIEILISYMYYQTGLWYILVEDRLAISIILTGTVFVLCFFRRHSQ